jgi:arylformamidase
MTQYRNRQEVSLEPIKTFDNDHVRLTRITMDSHTGTHIEAPAHFIHDGKFLHEIAITDYCGHCTILDMTSAGDCITQEHLELIPINQQSIVLLKTTNSELAHDAPFNPKFVYLSASGAKYLVERNIRAVGIDYVGIERDQEGHATHRLLMEHNIGILEGLRLAHVPAGNYFLVCLPLAFVGTEAGPARAVLFDEPNIIK